MTKDNQNLPELRKKIRGQLTRSQWELGLRLGISFATVNRWENSVVKPSKLAQARALPLCISKHQPELP